MDSIVHVQYLIILHLTDRIDSTIYQYYYLYTSYIIYNLKEVDRQNGPPPTNLHKVANTENFYMYVYFLLLYSSYVYKHEAI